MQMNGFTWSKIATMLEISRSTLYRKLQEAGVPTNDHIPLSDHQLDDIIRGITANMFIYNKKLWR